MESEEEVANRARRRLIAAKAHKDISWEEVFKAVDLKKSGQLSVNDFRAAVRDMLDVSTRALCDYDLRVLFRKMDTNGNNSVDLSELLEYLAQGPRRPEDEAARARLRISRARKNLKMGFQQRCNPSESEVRKLFESIDIDGDVRLSPYEFKQFVRVDLRLSIWDVSTGDLDALYGYLDRNGDGGICVDELLRFVRLNDRDRKKDFSFYENAKPLESVRRRKTFTTYKQKLVEENQGFGSGIASMSLPNLRPTPSMVSLGREFAPKGRNSLTKESMMFFTSSRRDS